MMNRLTLLALLAMPICQAAAIEIEAVEGSGYDDDAVIAIVGSGDVEPTLTPPAGNPQWQRKPQHHRKFPAQGSVTKPSQQRILGPGKKQDKGHDDYPPPPPGHPGHHHDGPRPDGPHGHPNEPPPPPHHSSGGGFDYLGLSPNVFIACAVAAGVVVLFLLVCICRKCRRDKCCRCCSKGAIGAASSGGDDTKADTRVLINGQYGTVITKAVVDKGKLAGDNPVPPPPATLAAALPQYNLAHSAGAAPPNYI